MINCIKTKPCRQCRADYEPTPNDQRVSDPWRMAQHATRIGDAEVAA
jgi:hypothetical protein